jgi:hypothetical protein
MLIICHLNLFLVFLSQSTLATGVHLIKYVLQLDLLHPHVFVGLLDGLKILVLLSNSIGELQSQFLDSGSMDGKELPMFHLPLDALQTGSSVDCTNCNEETTLYLITFLPQHEPQPLNHVKVSSFSGGLSIALLLPVEESLDGFLQGVLLPTHPLDVEDLIHGTANSNGIGPLLVPSQYVIKDGKIPSAVIEWVLIDPSNFQSDLKWAGSVSLIATLLLIPLTWKEVSLPGLAGSVSDIPRW